MASSELLMLFRELMKTLKKLSRGKKVPLQLRHEQPTATSSVPAYFLLLRRKKRIKSAEEMSSVLFSLVSVWPLGATLGA